MSEIARIIGERLRFRRLQLGYSQEYAAEKAGLHPTYIGQLERGEKNATLESIEKICTALQYPMDELFKNIIAQQPSENIPNQCYNLILGQSLKDQEFLLSILETVISFKLG